MNSILVRSAESAFAVAATLAKVVGAHVSGVPSDVPDEEFVRALDDPEVVMGVVAHNDGVWKIVRRSAVPIVLVPPTMVAAQYGIERVLVPLDGTEEASYAVAESVRLFCAAGIEIMVLHVFDSTTVPAHWDQAAHARAAWETEFLARFCAPYFPGLCQTLTLRSGAVGDNIVDVAAEQADLIVLGWSQRLEPGRAQIVRNAVATATVPVMLVPVTSG
ncbi:universal stress protein [Nocardia sp. NBC_01503]|uniref:universal stress protein n=1 Tax=Nocardia sp. NBC_01503 TaxID=2975997 RepID=UPI002E7B0E77|nr:universal stress protein [Nocardia sp. NBC_01503]WTL29085.1 universal stress protein [Nocardia sp. NBC_01503]